MAHIGIAVNDVKADAEWYIKMLGCETMGIFFTPNGEEVHFLKGNGVVYELFQPIVPVPEVLEGKIDHLALESENIDQDYLECQKNGCEICTDGIQSIPSFWENGIKYLFHGTKHENVWSILTTGIKNRPPKDTVLTGKAYGYGSYFAPDAIKSLGYTSRVGAKWTSGGQSYGLLLVCKVAVGKDGTYYDGHLGLDSGLCWEKLKSIAPDALCTWAESRYSGFMMDEVIVYQDCQDSVEYVIKVSA